MVDKSGSFLHEEARDMKHKKETAHKQICRRYCSYYKPGQKEDMACRGLIFVQSFIERHPESIKEFPSRCAFPFKDRYHHLLHHTICQYCDFLIDGCDFKDPGQSGHPPPCGGYLLLESLLEQALIDKDTLVRDLRQGERVCEGEIYPVLSPHCVLKHLEVPSLYDIQGDELYELDRQGFDFLQQCNGRSRLSDLTPDIDFIETCLKDKLLIIAPHADKRAFRVRPAPIPSLRYLELQLTSRCNLRCMHCYLGEPAPADLTFSHVCSVLDEFEDMQGLRVLFSGGEPMAYPQIRRLNEALPRYMFRKVLLTNGTLIREANYKDWCNFDEIQISLDGLKSGHEKMRGVGTFEQTMRGIEAAKQNDLPLSIATMVHRYNLDEFQGLSALINVLDVVEWNIDVPCAGGRLSEHRDYLVTPEEGAFFLDYAIGGSYHSGDEPYACGHHLCAVTPEGYIVKCGFFMEKPLGHIKEGLETSWKRMHHIALSELECAPCPHLMDCKGGCRFRADSLLGKDLVMCALYKDDAAS